MLFQHTLNYLYPFRFSYMIHLLVQFILSTIQSIPLSVYRTFVSTIHFMISSTLTTYTLSVFCTHLRMYHSLKSLISVVYVVHLFEHSIQLRTQLTAEIESMYSIFFPHISSKFHCASYPIKCRKAGSIFGLLTLVTMVSNIYRHMPDASGSGKVCLNPPGCAELALNTLVPSKSPSACV